MGWASKLTVGFLRRGHLETDMHVGRTPCDDEGRDRGDVPSSQRMPNTASKPPETRSKSWNWFSFTALRKDQSCLILDIRLLASRTLRINFGCLSPPLHGTLLQVYIFHAHKNIELHKHFPQNTLISLWLQGTFKKEGSKQYCLNFNLKIFFSNTNCQWLHFSIV